MPDSTVAGCHWLDRLGGPIRTVLQQLHARALAEGDAATIDALERVATAADGGGVSVRQVARAFDMLGAAADPADVLRVLLAPRHRHPRHGSADEAPRPAGQPHQPDGATLLHDVARDSETSHQAEASATPATAVLRSERRTRDPPSAAEVTLPPTPCIWWMDGRYAADFHDHRQAHAGNDADPAAGILWSRAVQDGCQAAAPRELALREWWYRTGWWLSSSPSAAEVTCLHPGPNSPLCGAEELARRQRILSGLSCDGWRTPGHRVLVRADPAAARKALQSTTATPTTETHNTTTATTTEASADTVDFRVDVLRRDAELEYHLPLSQRLAMRQRQRPQPLCKGQEDAVRELLAAWCEADGAAGGEFSELPNEDDDGTAELACGASVFAAAVVRCTAITGARPPTDAEEEPEEDGGDAEEAEWEPADGFDFGEDALGAAPAAAAADDDDVDDDGDTCADAESFSDWPSEDDRSFGVGRSESAADLEADAADAEPADASETVTVTDVAAWRIPLPTLVEPRDFRRAFAVGKLPASVARGGMEESLFRRRKPQSWALDHFAGEIVCFAEVGAAAATHRYPVTALLTVEKDTADATRLTLLFNAAAAKTGRSTKAVTLLFATALDRNTFYAHTQAMRPAARVFAPHLCHPYSGAVVTSCVVDGIGINSVLLPGQSAGLSGAPSVLAKFKATLTGKPSAPPANADLHLSGECRVNASCFLTEPVLVRAVTANVTDVPAGQLRQVLSANLAAQRTMTIDDDVVVIALHNNAATAVSLSPGPVGDDATGHLAELLLDVVNATAEGRPFVLVASQHQGTTILVVIARARHLPKIAAVAGTGVPLSVPSSLGGGGYGGVAIALSLYETRVVFAACQLIPRAGRAELRQEMLRSFFAGIEGHAPTSPAHADHTILFGELNACLDPTLISCDDAHAVLDMAEADGAEGTTSLIDYDELNQHHLQLVDEGTAPVLQEAAPVSFPPTFRPDPASKVSPGYPARVFVASHTGVADGGAKCLSYRAADGDSCGGSHKMVSACFRIACTRPAASLGNGDHAVDVPSMLVVTDLAVSGAAAADLGRFDTVAAFGTCVEPVPATPFGQELVVTPATTVAAALAASSVRFTVTVSPSAANTKDKQAHRAYAVLSFTTKDVAVVVGGSDGGDSRAFEVPLVSGGRRIGILSGVLCNMGA